ncbi:MAG: hypothetical protein ACIALR_12875 [Blastopirellula sp. JB062]
MALLIHNAISGFTQSQATWHGTIDLAEKLRETHCDGVRSRVHYFRWCEDWDAVAAYHLSLAEQYRQKPTIGIYAYSWGAGWGAMQLAKQLRRRGLPVRVMVLSDPIYRHPIALWRSLRNAWLPIVGEPLIRVPDNVKEVFTFHHLQNRPSGHKLISASRTNGALIHPPQLLHYDHQYMDDAPEFHRAALDQAARICAVAQSTTLEAIRRGQNP